MEASAEVRAGILGFYERFSAGDVDAFASGISEAPGVSVVGSAPGEGHDGRDEWIGAYRNGAAAGIRLEGDNPRAYAEGALGWGVDNATFVLPDGGVCRPGSRPSCVRKTASGGSSISTSRSASSTRTP